MLLTENGFIQLLALANEMIMGGIDLKFREGSTDRDYFTKIYKRLKELMNEKNMGDVTA